MPDKATVFRRLAANVDFLNSTRARARLRPIRWSMKSSADDATNDWHDRHNADGEVIGRELDHENITRSRLRIDSRKRFASKVAPKKYSRKLQLARDTDNPPLRAKEMKEALAAKLNHLIGQRTGRDQEQS